MNRTMIGTIVVAAAALAAPGAALAGTQTFAVDGNGVFDVRAAKATGGEVDLANVTNARIFVKDIKGDLVVDPAFGTPAGTGPHGGMWFKIGDAPVAGVLKGTNFIVRVTNTSATGHIGAVVKSYGRVRLLRIKGTYQVGDLAVETVTRGTGPHHGWLITNPLSFTGRGGLRGTLTTPADGVGHFSVQTARHGRIRFVDMSVAQDLNVSCPAGRLAGNDGHGHGVVICNNLRGGASASGSLFTFHEERNYALVLKLDDATKGSIEGHSRGILEQSGGIRIDRAGFNRYFVTDALDPAV